MYLNTIDFNDIINMTSNVHFVPTLLGALNNTYDTDSYVRTLGFAEAGDGGAAMYEVTSTSGAPVTYSNVSVYCEDGRFSKTAFTCFKLIPQNGKVYAEQFGVLPGDTVDCNTNTTMMNRAVDYASRKGFVLTFASNKTYYFSSSIVIKSNLFIEGNGAILRVHDEASNSCNLFNMTSNTDLQSNVTVRNLTVVGRTIDGLNKGDQAFHVCLDGFTLQNVAIKNFSFGVHTYGRKATIDDYTVPEIPNKNWLIDGCTITDTIMGLQLSEIDGITVKDSTITSIYPSKRTEADIYDNSGGDHNIYMGSNCLNVRITNVAMGNVTGDAIHKAFAPKGDKDAGYYIRADVSKNHFYTDVSIDKANSPLTIGIISENVMCDNVFGSNLRYCVNISSADNCIISNSSLSVTRDKIDKVNKEGQPYKENPNACIVTADSAKCWFQNTHLAYNGQHRKALDLFNAASAIPRVYYKTLSENKKHRRNYIGPNFDINNYMFKFTGCDIESTYNETNYYFEPLMRGNETDWLKTTVSEYWDNCNIKINTGENLFRPKCINDLATGITIRNSYFYNEGVPRALFKFQCEHNHMYCDTNCYWGSIGKRFPGIRIENSVFNHAGYSDSSEWNHLASIHTAIGSTFTLKDAINISNSYVSNSYRVADNIHYKLNMLMAE